MKKQRRRTAQVPWRTLREARESVGVSQSQLGYELGTSQPAVLHAESAANPRVDSVRTYVEGLARAAGVGHDLQVIATVGDEQFKVRFPKADGSGAAVASAAPPSPPSSAAADASPAEANGVTAWRVRSWDDPDLEKIWLDRGLIAVGREEMGDLTEWPGEREVRRRLIEALPERSAQAIGMFVTYWRYFCVDMRPDDMVAVPLARRRVGIARVAGDYRYVSDSSDPRLWHQRPVEWLRTMSRDELDDDIRKVVNAPGTICQINARGAVERLERG